jgi:hypothetical protein
MKARITVQLGRQMSGAVRYQSVLAQRVVGCGKVSGVSSSHEAASLRWIPWLDHHGRPCRLAAEAGTLEAPGGDYRAYGRNALRAIGELSGHDRFCLQPCRGRILRPAKDGYR